jgi:predicted ester cyclase
VRRKGTIINLSGGGAGAPAPYWSGYASSKAAILRFTDSLAGEVAQFGIQVYALGPGLVRTVMTETLLQHPRVAEYAPWFPAALTSGHDVSPEAAGQLAVRLASLKAAELSGRAFSVGDDMDYIVSQSTIIAEGDFYTLRMRKPPTFERDLASTGLEGKTLIQRLFSEVVNRQMLDQLDDMVGAEFRLSPNGASGPDALRDLIRWLHATFSDLEYDVEDLIAEGDRVVARTRAQGIHRGAYLGIAATGRRVSFTETFIFRISDRRIAEWWIDTNRIAILQQIGVTFTAPDS